MSSTYQVYNPFYYKPYAGYHHPQHTYASDPVSSTITMQNPDFVVLDNGLLRSTCQTSSPYLSSAPREIQVCQAPCPTAYLGLPISDQHQDSSPSASSLSSSSSYHSSSSSLEDFCVGDLLETQPHQQYFLPSSFNGLTNTNDPYYAQRYSMPQPQPQQLQLQQQQVSPLSEYWISPITPLMESMNGYITMIDPHEQQQQQQMLMKQEEEDLSVLLPSSSSLPYVPNITCQQPSFSGISKKKSKKIHHCPHCHHTSNRANNMKEHILTHDPYRPKLFTCDTCQKLFARKHDMKRHVKSHSRVPRRQKK